MTEDARFRERSSIHQGSVLFYNLYSSSATAPATQNLRISITNTNDQASAFIHLYFIDGSSCSVADNFICLTANQTASFLASDIDPGVTGYVLAIAVDGVDGLPVQFDFLIGDEYVKLASGHFANLGAESFAVAIPPLLIFPVDGSNGSPVALLFDGICYHPAPRVLADDNIPSPTDGNNTLLVVNRFGGDLSSTAGTIGSIFGLLYDDAENTFSYNFSSGACQFRSSISDAFPRTVPRVSSIIPAGRTGWTKFWTTTTVDNRPFGTAADDRAILGAVLNITPRAGAAADSFSGGRNMHKLTFAPFAIYILPVFPPSC